MDELPALPGTPEPTQLREAGLQLQELPELRPEPGSLGALRPPLLNIALFLGTALSATLAGVLFEEGPLNSQTIAHAAARALAFSGALLAILLAHEMGHFLLARRHGVDASWPFFIPAPFLSFIGTLGAVIRLRSLPRSRRALIDIGAMGPLCGLLVTIPVLWVGLKLSTVVHLAEGSGAGWTLWDAVATLLRTGNWPLLREGVDLGEPLLMQLFEALVFGPLPTGQAINLHPVAVAGWFGLLLTAINLLPLGQLDGGHLLYGGSPRLHRALGAPLSAGLLALGVFTPFTGWMLWGLLTGTVLSRHPPLPETEPALDQKRKLLLLLCVVSFVLCFTPAPLSLLLK